MTFRSELGRATLLEGISDSSTGGDSRPVVAGLRDRPRGFLFTLRRSDGLLPGVPLSLYPDVSEALSRPNLGTCSELDDGWAVRGVSSVPTGEATVCGESHRSSRRCSGTRGRCALLMMSLHNTQVA